MKMNTINPLSIILDTDGVILDFDKGYISAGQYLFDKEISYPSHYVIIKEAATINERIIDLLAKKVKENFKEYSEITDSTENSDNIRDINFKTPNLFSKNINMYISKDGRLFIAISPEKFE